MLIRSRWAAALLFTACVPSFGATQYFINDQAGWLAATSLATTIDFSQASPGYTPPTVGQTLIVPPSGLSIGNVLIENFIKGPTLFFAVNANPSTQPWYDWGSGAMLRSESTTAFYQPQEQRFKITLPTGITSFGVNLGSGDVPTATFQLKVNGTLIGQTLTTSLKPNLAHFGVTSDTNITTIEVLAPLNSYIFLDNLAYGVVTASQPPPIEGGEVPEVSTLMMSASALLFLAKYRRPSNVIAN